MFARFRDENATITTGRLFTPGILPPDVAQDRVEILTLSDGRCLAWSEYGHRHGYPLIYLHREGGARVEAKLLHEAACAAGFRLISVDRPGIGYSSFKPLNVFDDLVADYEQLIRHLNLKHVGLVSWGAGSVLALALAKGVKEKISIVTLVSPSRTQSGLPDVWGLRWLATMGMRLVLSVRSHRMKADETRYFLRWREQLCFADKKHVDNPWVSSLLVDVARQSLRQGAAGAAQDLMLALSQKNVAENVLIPVHEWSDGSEASSNLISTSEGSLYFRHFIRRQGKLFINRAAADIFNTARQSIALSPVVCDLQRH